MTKGTDGMYILYNDKTDLLYLRFDDRTQEVINRRISEDIVLDIGEDNRIVGIEILDASKRLTLGGKSLFIARWPKCLDIYDGLNWGLPSSFRMKDAERSV